MTAVTLNGNPYSDDGSTARDMLNGGHRTYFFLLLQDFLIEAGFVEADAAVAAAAAATAVSAMAGYSATSATSKLMAVGALSFTFSTGKQFQAGDDVVIFRTSDTTKRLYGRLSGYTSGSGATTIDVSSIQGAGTFSDWTMRLSGERGDQGIPAGMTRRSIAGADTVLSSDTGTVLDLSGTSYTLAFQPCATLASGSWFWLRGRASGTITLDPNAAELIDGAATYLLEAGHTALVHCDGAALRVVFDAGPVTQRYPIFSTKAATASAISTLEEIAPNVSATGLSASGIVHVVYGNSLFIAAQAATANGNVASSPDGTTWTLRAMPSSAAWLLGTNGTDKFLATIASSTTCANSTSGTVWASGTALPGTANANYSFPAFIGATAIVPASAASTMYRSTDNGATWSTEATPAAIGSRVLIVNSLFWFYSSGTTAYTSATGLAGSWTARTLPITPSSTIFKQTNGSLSIHDGASGTPQYETSDGINWASTGVNMPGTAGNAVLINGVRALHSTTFGSAQTYHNSAWVKRSASAAVLVSTQPYGNSGTKYCFGSSAADGRVQMLDTAAVTPTALFGG